MRTSNPSLSDKAFRNVPPGEGQMTLSGTVNKAFIMLILIGLTAVFTWQQIMAINSMAMGVVWPAAILGFIVGLVTIFKKNWSPKTAPLYALIEGVVLGAISAIMETVFPGIVLQAVLLTFGILFVLLFIYKSGWIKVTQNFRLGVLAATGGICLIYIITWILGMFGTTIPYIHESGAIGIGFSIFVVIIASLNLVLDFDYIEKASEAKVPKYMEWYGAFGLMVTLIWLYLEILRLLAKSRNR